MKYDRYPCEQAIKHGLAGKGGSGLEQTHSMMPSKAVQRLPVIGLFPWVLRQATEICRREPIVRSGTRQKSTEVGREGERKKLGK